MQNVTAITRLTQQGYILFYDDTTIVGAFKPTDQFFIADNPGSLKAIGVSSEKAYTFGPNATQTNVNFAPNTLLFQVENLTSINNLGALWSRTAVSVEPGTVFEDDYEDRFTLVVQQLSTLFLGCCGTTINIDGGNIEWYDYYGDLPVPGTANTIYVTRYDGQQYEYRDGAYHGLIVPNSSITLYSYENFI